MLWQRTANNYYKKKIKDMTNLKNIALAFTAMVIFSNITNAQTIKASYTANTVVNTAEPINVKYLGDDGEYLLFQVTLQAAQPPFSVFEIEDKTEGQLYSSDLERDFKVKTVKIEKRDGQVLNFKLIAGKKIFSKSFSVNTSLVETTTVAETDVTKL